jgi:hypothetical protein
LPRLGRGTETELEAVGFFELPRFASEELVVKPAFRSPTRIRRPNHSAAVGKTVGKAPPESQNWFERVETLDTLDTGWRDALYRIGRGERIRGRAL